jgi:tryptophanyl-tRNA synthetase
MKKKLFSGIQPSGEVHIGNYLGAIRNWVKMMDQYDGIYCIVDYHAITIKYDISQMQTRILNAAADLLACGIDPEKCTLFVQSKVAEHTELAWVLSSVTPMGDLERMTQFKEKSKQNQKNINAGLFTYPVLQSADILLYKAEVVPVGEDQIQHIELSREIARKFNSVYGETFPEPAHIVPNVGRILGLDGNAKMSKSLNNFIGLAEDDETITKKLMPAKTDPARQRRSDPGTPEKCNVYTLHKLLSSEEEVTQVARGCRSAEIGCVDCKKILLKNMLATIAPIREKIFDLRARPDYLKDVLNQGAKKCKQIAQATMEEVKTRMGIV